MASNRERMVAGEPYSADDPELIAANSAAQLLLERYNAIPDAQQSERDLVLAQLLGSMGEGVVIKPSLRCDYGTNISIGDRTWINYDAVMLDPAPITIGADCMFATRIQLLTATHPIDARTRTAGWESAHPITIGDRVWLGGGAIVCPGVTIGDETVVGAGAVVTRDLPPGVVAVGNPARVLREIGPADRPELGV